MYLHSNSTQILTLKKFVFSLFQTQKKIPKQFYKKKFEIFFLSPKKGKKQFFLGLKFEWNLSVNT